jgi:hypothetical protein
MSALAWPSHKARRAASSLRWRWNAIGDCPVKRWNCRRSERSGGGSDFAGSERPGEATLHEPNGHHDASRGRTLGRHRYIRGKAGCLILYFPDSDLLSSAALDLPGTSDLSQGSTLSRRVRRIVYTPLISRGHGTLQARSGKGRDPTPLFMRGRPPRTTASMTAVWGLAGSLAGRIFSAALR